MSNIPELQNVPEISFIDNITLEDVRNLMLSKCADYYESIGQPREFPPADPIRVVSYAIASLIYQGFQYVDRKGKVDLLKYSFGGYLDNIAALKRIFRKPAAGAITMLRFNISAIRTSATGIRAGVRVRDENGNCFATNEYAEIPAGESYVDIQATAIEPGRKANGLPIDTIKYIVDPVPYISSVTNVVPSSGGDDVEGDDDLTYRTLMAPAGYSVAGPKEAYEYWARQFRTDIADVEVYTPAPTEVVILFMLDNGVAPDGTIIASLENFLRSAVIRPLTDKVTVDAPEDVVYDLNMVYYINRSDESRASSIQMAVMEAVEEYKKWQRKIGRDINPDELIRKVREAGAKRVVLSSFDFKSVLDTQIAQVGSESITYGGLEND